MKKKYVKPLIEVFGVEHDQHILTGSSRTVEGGITSEGVPTGVGETTDTPDPFGNQGQDGNSNRAPGFFGDLE